MLLSGRVVYPMVDFHTKRELYLREGVAEYWVIDPEARILFRWSGSEKSGDAISHELRWKPDGMADDFVLNLPQFFDEALR